jgi:hypothetical protein
MYTYRWRVDRYHYVLKSGCRIEQRHLETTERLASCLAVYAMTCSPAIISLAHS